MLAQMGMPGSVELFVILVVAVVVFGLPLVVIAVVGALWLRSDDDYDERIRELETEIARLEAQVGDGAAADEFADPDGTGDRPTDGGRSSDPDDE
jgi:sec-independent protein translocase protein TatA